MNFVGGHLGGEAVFTYHGETGRLHSKSLPSSTFLGLPWVTVLSWHWRSKFFFWLKSVGMSDCGPNKHLSQFCPRSASATSLTMSRCVDVVKGLLE